MQALYLVYSGSQFVIYFLSRCFSSLALPLPKYYKPWYIRP